MPLIFDCSEPGRRGATLPRMDVPEDLGGIPPSLRREKPAKLPELTELEVIRHYTNLSRKNFGLNTHFYPLGSCTMKYNPAFHEELVKLPGFAEIHPLLPQLRGGEARTQGALAALHETGTLLAELTGFTEFTLQPLAGAHGELTGVMLMAAYFRARGETTRRVMLIPDAAHGTNPASAVVAGFECRVVATNAQGNVDMDDLQAKLSPEVAGLMLTCPNTLGLFDPEVENICKLVHQAGGLVYCDGANFNAIMGRVRPGDLGFDVMHLNLHKSFATPHGGGGPGSGPVGVGETLQPFLPVPRVRKGNDGVYSLESNYPDSMGRVAPFFGNFGVLLKAYAYLLTLGNEGVRRVGENAVLNANYVRVRLNDLYADLYGRTCMHECVLSAKPFAANDVHALDIAKALIDRGIHPPTMYFPLIVPEALMIEPTETESKSTLDNFIDAMREIAEQANSTPDTLKQAPRTTPVGRLDETRAARKPDLAAL